MTLTNNNAITFNPKLKNTLVKKFCDLCHSFDPIDIYTCLALQNDCQNLNFVKDICVVGKESKRFL